MSDEPAGSRAPDQSPDGTRCRSCNARIVFAKMATSGKYAPFESDADGEWIIVEGVASHQGKAPAWQPPERTVPRWTSHFAVCPQAGHWRRGKK